MVAAENFGEKFAQTGGAKIRAFGVKILRRYWGIYRQSFVQKEAEMGPNLRGNQILFRVYYDSCRNRKLLEVEDALVGPSCQRKKSSNAACALLVLLLLVAGTAACACAQPR
jgi:hypothetical protein